MLSCDFLCMVDNGDTVDDISVCGKCFSGIDIANSFDNNPGTAYKSIGFFIF